MDFLTEEEEGIVSVYEVYTNLLYMLSDRGYTVNMDEVGEKKEFWKRIDDWSSLNKRYYRDGAKGKGKGEKECIQTVWIPIVEGNQKVKKDQWTNELSKINTENIDCKILFVSKTPLGNQASDKLNSMNDMFNEFFTFDRLLIRVPEHFMVQSEIEKLEKEEVMEIMKNLGIKPSNFKIISTEDMLVRWYGFRPGDVIRIITDSQHLKRQVDYKIVTPVSSTNSPFKSNEIFN